MSTNAQTWVLQGDCLERLRELPDNSIAAVVTDPPYGLGKEPDMAEVVRHWCAAELRAYAAKHVGTAAALALFPEERYDHGGGGFMGKSWDSFVPGPEVWREVYRVLKPGGHVASFSGTRTYDLTVLAMRIAGFEIRDQLAWMYGSGFPKSLDVSKAIDANAGAVREVTRPESRPLVSGDVVSFDQRSSSERERRDRAATAAAAAWAGWGTALKPAQEPIVLARKPLVGTVAANVLAHGTGALNVDGCRVGTDERYNPPVVKGWQPDGTYSGRDDAGKTVVGRWPANVIMDEAAGAMLDEQSGYLRDGVAVNRNRTERKDSVVGYTSKKVDPTDVTYGGGGGASRFFYCAKTSRAEREAGLDHLPARAPTEITGRDPDSAGQKHARSGMPGGEPRRNVHPTVKPIALMRWLIRLITPPGGMVLDPYAGSGSTLCAAVLEGHSAIGIEITPEYVPIIEGRVAYWRTEASAEAA